MGAEDAPVAHAQPAEDGLALGGKKRTLTVMMSDLRGFTAMSERMEAGDLLTMLNHYLGEMTDVIQKRNGTIIEFIGDGIMAIFGAPAYSKTHAGDAAAAAKRLKEQKITADAVIVDPPRKGCSEELLRTIANDFVPERIVYISCDPTTQARDVKVLLEKGYEITAVCPVDMFPRTSHVETVALLKK